MKWQFWSKNGRSPTEDEVVNEIGKDAESFKRFVSAINVLENGGYEALRKAKRIDKLKGRNPMKIHEFRFSLKNKIGRVLFIVNKKSEAVLLHFFAKKTDKIPEKNRLLAENRAKEYWS